MRVQQVPLSRRPGARIGVGVAALLVFVALAALGVYVFGGNGAKTPAGSVAAPTLAPTGSGQVFTIDGSASQASFTIDEVLFGKPNTVVGSTSAVAGQVRVDEDTPAKTQLGQFRVDLRTLATDSDLRNRTLQNRIFETGNAANQYAVFTPKTCTGLPSSITLGQPVRLTITGDLKLHGVTRTVTFDATVTMVSATQIKGQAAATVKYQDFGLVIPDVPSVSSVGDTVTLTLDFTARA